MFFVCCLLLICLSFFFYLVGDSGKIKEGKEEEMDVDTKTNKRPRAQTLDGMYSSVPEP